MKSLAPLCCVGWLAAVAPPAIAAVSAVDDSGHSVTLAAPAQRIVSLAPHITELLFAAGLGPRVVGVSAYSNYPEEAAKLPNIGSYAALDLERIAALQPDLVVGWVGGNPKPQLAALRQLRLPLFNSDPREFAGIAANLRRLAILGGTAEAGERAAREFEQGLTLLRASYAQRRQVSAFYQVWNEPLQTVNGASSISAVLRLCGGRNVFAELPALAPRVSVEAVLEANPEAIIASGMDLSRPEWLDAWKRWPRLRAVQAGNLFHVPPDYLQRPTPRLLQGAQRVCAALDVARQRPSAQP